MTDEKKISSSSVAHDSLSTVRIEEKIDFALRTLTTAPLEAKIEAIAPIQAQGNAAANGPQNAAEQTGSGKKEP